MTVGCETEGWKVSWLHANLRDGSGGDMVTFTLDTNCIIDVAEGRPAARFVKSLLDAHAKGADVALVASSASERQQDGGFLANLSMFQERCRSLGFGDLALLPPIARWGVSFYGIGLYSWPEGMVREKAIYQRLFPNSSFEWRDFAEERQADPDDQSTPAYFRWRNQMLDAQAYWAHENAGRSVFVTSDRRFRVLTGCDDFPNACILDPEGAANLLE